MRKSMVILMVFLFLCKDDHTLSQGFGAQNSTALPDSSVSLRSQALSARLLCDHFVGRPRHYVVLKRAWDSLSCARGWPADVVFPVGAFLIAALVSSEAAFFAAMIAPTAPAKKRSQQFVETLVQFLRSQNVALPELTTTQDHFIWANYWIGLESHLNETETQKKLAALVQLYGEYSIYRKGSVEFLIEVSRWFENFPSSTTIEDYLTFQAVRSLRRRQKSVLTSQALLRQMETFLQSRDFRKARRKKGRGLLEAA